MPTSFKIDESPFHICVSFDRFQYVFRSVYALSGTGVRIIISGPLNIFVCNKLPVYGTTLIIGEMILEYIAIAKRAQSKSAIRL